MRYAQIRKMDISNGERIGVSLFVQGCRFHCKGCFNIDTWDFNGGKEWTKEVENEFLNLIDRPYIKRISILGGEPLADENIDGILELLNKIDYPGKEIWIYTGYLFEDLKSKFEEAQYTPFTPNTDKWITRYEIISKCNVLVDGRFEEDKKDLTLKFRGSSNQRVINVQQSIKEGRVVLWTS